MIFVLLFIFILMLVSAKSNSIRFLLILLYIGTLSVNFLIGTDLSVQSFSDILYVIWTVLVLSLLFKSWNYYTPIESFEPCNEKKLKRFVYIVGTLCIFMTIGCAGIAYAVSQVVEDINVFKYRDGQADVYESLGMSMKPYILAYILYPISYLFIPLIFYYLSKKEYLLMLLCFLSSLASVSYGLAYFSRSHTIQYVLLLLTSYWMFRKTLSETLRKKIEKLGIILIFCIAASFIAISNSRFQDKDYANQKKDAVIKNTVIYSLADYTGMWWYAGRDVFEDFHFETMRGRIALQSVNRVLSMASIVPSTSEQNAKMRDKLLKDHSGNFIGVSTYFLYDTGIMISLFILLIYSYIVYYNRPRNGSMTVNHSMSFVILLLLPLFGIFYSTLDIIILLALYYWGFKKVLL